MAGVLVVVGAWALMGGSAGGAGVPDGGSATGPGDVAARAATFLSLLDGEARGKAMYDLGHEEQFNWNFTPVSRNGLPLKDMTMEQRAAAPRAPPDHPEQPGIPQGQRDHRAGARPRHPRGPAPAARSRGLLRHHLRHAGSERRLGVALRGPPPFVQLLVAVERADRDRAGVHGGQPGDRPVRREGGVAPRWAARRTSRAGSCSCCRPSSARWR